MDKKPKKYYYWSNPQVLKHRKAKINNALNRRDDDYMKERQKKIYKLIPNSLMGKARIEFLRGIPIEPDAMNIPIDEEKTLKTNPKNNETNNQ